MIREILRFPLPRRRRACDFAAVNEHTVQVMRDLVETLLASEAQGCLGLAAPQIGEAIRVIAVRDDVPATTRINPETKRRETVEGKTIVHALVNPRIIKRSGIKLWSAEHCMSDHRALADRLPIRRRRDTKIEVVAYDSEGNQTLLLARGLLATVVQHEIDHLEGRTLFDDLEPARPYARA